MAKKKGTKRFLEVLKFYLSSMTSRNCKYLYFNCFEDPKTLIFTNGDYTLLTQEGYNLSIHILKIKNDNVYDEWKEIFNFDTTEPYVVHIKKCLDVINKCIKTGDELKTYIDTENQLLLTTESDIRSAEELATDLTQEAQARYKKDLESGTLTLDDDNETDEDTEIDMSDIVLPLLEYSHAFGTKFSDYRNFITLKEQASYVLDTYEQLQQRPFLNIEPTELEIFRSNIYKYHLDLSRFIDSLGFPIFNDVFKRHHTYLLQDGLDLPSIKEYLRKLTPDWEVKMYSVVDTTDRVRFLTVTSNEDMDIISMRPYAGIIPIKKITTDKDKVDESDSSS
jgi:hypothetical protein